MAPTHLVKNAHDKIQETFSKLKQQCKLYPDNKNEPLTFSPYLRDTSQEIRKVLADGVLMSEPGSSKEAVSECFNSFNIDRIN